MITLLSILRELGPGYWAEFRYIKAGLEVNLHFRNTPNDLVMRKAIIFTDEFIVEYPEMAGAQIRDEAKALEAAVTIKLHTND